MLEKIKFITNWIKQLIKKLNWFESRLSTKLLTAFIGLIAVLFTIGWYIALSFPWWHIPSLGLHKYTKEPVEVLRNIIWTVGLIIGGSFALLGFVNSIHRTQQKDIEIRNETKRIKDDRIAQRRQMDSEIFSKSVNQLGHDNQAVRLGGLYALEQLALTAKDRKMTPNNKAYLNSILETIAAFVRVHTPIPAKNQQTNHDFIKPDVEAALNILVRVFSFELRKIIRAKPVNLSKTYLPVLHLPTFSDMREFNFTFANLKYCSLTFVDLSGSDLSMAIITENSLKNCVLNEASVGYFEDDEEDYSFEFINNAIWDPKRPPLVYLHNGAKLKVEDRSRHIIDENLWDKYQSIVN